MVCCQLIKRLKDKKKKVFKYIEHKQGGGRDTSGGITTRYGLDGPGIESWWGARFSASVQTGPRAHPASNTVGTGVFRGVTLYSYTTTPPLGLRGLY
jgi:hypothetical protein